MKQRFTNYGINGAAAQGTMSDTAGGSVASGYEDSAIYLSIEHKILRIEIPPSGGDTQS